MAAVATEEIVREDFSATLRADKYKLRSTFTTELLFDSIDDAVMSFKSEITPASPPVPIIKPARLFTGAFFALRLQAIFRPAVFIELALVFPLPAMIAQLLFDSVDDSMTFLISEIFSSSFPIPLTAPACAFIEAFLTPVLKAVFGRPIPKKLSFVFPSSTFTTEFLFDSIENSMTVFISEVSSSDFPVSLVTPAPVFTIAFLASAGKTVFRPAVSVKLALVFPALTMTAQLLFDSIDDSLTFLIS